MKALSKRRNALRCSYPLAIRASSAIATKAVAPMFHSAGSMLSAKIATIHGEIFMPVSLVLTYLSSGLFIKCQIPSIIHECKYFLARLRLKSALRHYKYAHVQIDTVARHFGITARFSLHRADGYHYYHRHYIDFRTQPPDYHFSAFIGINFIIARSEALSLDYRLPLFSYYLFMPPYSYRWHFTHIRDVNIDFYYFVVTKMISWALYYLI